MCDRICGKRNGDSFEGTPADRSLASGSSRWDWTREHFLSAFSGATLQRDRCVGLLAVRSDEPSQWPKHGCEFRMYDGVAFVEFFVTFSLHQNSFRCNRYRLGTIAFSFVIAVEYSVNLKQPTSVCILIVTYVRFVIFVFVIQRFNCSCIFFSCLFLQGIKMTCFCNKPFR